METTCSETAWQATHGWFRPTSGGCEPGPAGRVSRGCGGRTPAACGWRKRCRWANAASLPSWSSKSSAFCWEEPRPRWCCWRDWRREHGKKKTVRPTLLHLVHTTLRKQAGYELAQPAALGGCAGLSSPGCLERCTVVGGGAAAPSASERAGA